jgi:hypothetical protein
MAGDGRRRERRKRGKPCAAAAWRAAARPAAVYRRTGFFKNLDQSRSTGWISSPSSRVKILHRPRQLFDPE